MLRVRIDLFNNLVLLILLLFYRIRSSKRLIMHCVHILVNTRPCTLVCCLKCRQLWPHNVRRNRFLHLHLWCTIVLTQAFDEIGVLRNVGLRLLQNHLLFVSIIILILCFNASILNISQKCRTFYQINFL